MDLLQTFAVPTVASSYHLHSIQIVKLSVTPECPLP